MPYSQDNLGTTLALLKKHIDHNIEINWESEQGTHVKELQEFYFTLKNQINDLHYNVPKYQCPSTATFLKDNTDFFIKYLILNDQSSQLTEEVQHVIKHINDCYWCFLEYSKIMKQYTTKMIYLGRGE